MLSKSVKKILACKKKSSTRRTKLYEMSPFADPRKERDRLNALTAKMTREKKKQQFLSAQDQIVQLKTMNSKLMKQAKLERAKLAAAQKEKATVFVRPRPDCSTEDHEFKTYETSETGKSEASGCAERNKETEVDDLHASLTDPLVGSGT